jgi:ABC-type amino acid transport substrate-binding protein
MKTRFAALMAASFLSLLTAGCIKTVTNEVKPGVPLLKDKIVSRYERPVQPIFDAAKDVLANLGTLAKEDRINNTVEAKVDNRTVRVRVDAEEGGVSRVTTQVRTKIGGADVDLAAEVDKQIALKLK